ncbi:MAG: metal ABC transporter substrate-binding protein [Treponema sp.]|nr:metal ABC transporter substrate-binding protein [Treponema sp.]
MTNNKKIIATILLSILILFSSCKARKVDLSGKVNVVCTIFPLYDWTLQIIGKYFNNTTNSLIAKSSMDMHSYQPTTYDFVQISNADILVWTGGESESWINDALKNATNKDMIVINLTELLKEHNRAKEEVIIEGMQEEDHSLHLAEHTHDSVEYDEHVWLSLKNAKIAVQAISDALSSLDKENAENYKKNLEAYLTELDGLDFEYQAAVDKANQKTLIFCDRFPFRYLTDDYGLSYYAAFTGCSAETEASFETMAFLSKKVDELGVKAVCKIDGSTEKMARTVIRNSSHKMCDIITLDSMQSTSLRAAFEGKTYTSTMRKNLEELKKALQ